MCGGKTHKSIFLQETFCVYVCVGFAQERFLNFNNNRFLKRRNCQINLVSNEEFHRKHAM